MKKCNKCGYENPNTESVCENCYSVLDNKISEETSEEFSKSLKEKKK